MFEEMSAIILTQNSQNFYSFGYFGIGSDSFYFHFSHFYKLGTYRAISPTKSLT